MLKLLKYCLFVAAFFVFTNTLASQLFASNLSKVIALLIAISVTVILRKKINAISFNNFFLVLVFVTIIFTIFIGPKEQKSTENRNLANFPNWRWSNVWKFFSGYSDYVDDRFYNRSNFIQGYGYFIYEKLKLNPINNRAIIGKDEWMFYFDKQYCIDISKPFTHEELKILHYNLVLTTKWFEKHGIHYYLTIPPVKPRIYPEKLPDFLRIKLSYSRLKQFKAYLNSKSSYNFIDYWDELQKAKQHNEQIYYKTDTHWNEHGSFIGYTKILNTIKNDFPEIKINTKEQYKEEVVFEYSGDLIQMIGFNPKIIATRYKLTPKDSSRIELIYITESIKHENGFQKFKNETPPNDLKLFVIRDSYTEHLKEFFNQSFSEVVYAWMPTIPLAKINEEKPDIIVHEILERFTFFYLDLTPEIKNDTAFVNQFNIEDF